MNYNECENINITEDEQHELSTLYPHICLKYNCRVFHRNTHLGLNSYIEPCEQCRKEITDCREEDFADSVLLEHALFLLNMSRQNLIVCMKLVKAAEIKI